jgi:hypothetical protein
MSALDTLQISRVLKAHPKSSGTFVGCVPSDRIPVPDTYPYAAVINTDPTKYGGQHWVAVYVSSPHSVEYFDSYGNTPNKNIGSFLDNFSHIKRSTFALQGFDTNSCGYYCIYFIMKRCAGRSFEWAIDRLRRLRERDKYVVEYVLRIIPLCSRF